MQILPVPLPLQSVGAPAGKNPPDGAGDVSFQDMFDKALQNLNDKQLNANQTVEKYLTGEVQDMHTVMLAMGQARLSMQLAVEVRNKLVEAYQELSRMQV